MNRRKKINQILKKRATQANAKVNTKKKPAYVSKADREALLEVDIHTSTDHTKPEKR